MTDGYERFRPSNTMTRRQRMSLIGQCMDSRRARLAKMKDTASAWSYEKTEAWKTNDGDSYNGARSPGKDRFHDHRIHPVSNCNKFMTTLNKNPPDIKMDQTNVILPMISPEHPVMQGQVSSCFDSFSEMEFSPTILNDGDQCYPTVEASLGTGHDTQAQPAGLLPSSLDPMLLPDVTPPEPADDDLWTAEVIQEPMYAIAGASHNIETGIPHNEAITSVTRLTDTSSDSHKCGSDYSQLTQETDSLEVHSPAMALSLFQSGHRLNSMTSKISNILDRSSRYSSTERQSVLDVLQSFSASTISNHSTSICSRISSLSSRLSGTAANGEVDPLQQETNESTCVATSGSLPTRTREELPGDFILSAMNTFLDHLQIGSQFCEGCFTDEQWETASLSIPNVVTHLKRGFCIDLETHFSQWDWVDRFGNTALHIVAAAGPTVHQLLQCIDRGLEVNALNTARQTFLHILDPWRILSVADNVLLRHHLVQLQFNFEQKDILGRKFVECWARPWLPSPPAARWWLESLGGNDDKLGIWYHARDLENSGSLRGLQVWHHRCSESKLSEMRAAHHLTINENDPESVYHLLAHQKEYPGLIETYLASHGRNCLHVTVEARKILPSSRLSLVERLLNETTIDVNHHDRSGNTPLMTSIRLSPNEHQVDIITKMLGHKAQIDLRNHKGESALHLAVKLGQIGATQALLSHGANVHVRSKRRLGVLAVGEFALRRAVMNIDRYARIMACISRVVDAGAVAEPTLFQEWDLQRP